MHFQRLAAPAILCAFVMYSSASAELVTLNPVEDTFSIATFPDSTFGASGALNVSGPAAVNGVGEAQGKTDTWLKFNTAAAVAQFDVTFGAGNWVLSSATLSLREVAQPNNPIFNRGVGQFEVLWIASDNWSAGPGGPGAPGTATGNQIGYSYGLSILNGAADATLGTFSNAGTNTQQAFGLGLAPAFTGDVAAGGALTLYLTSVSPTVGFTFNSGDTSNAPQLRLEAVLIPEPATLGPACVAAALWVRRRRG